MRRTTWLALLAVLWPLWAWAGNSLSPSDIEQWRLYDGRLHTPSIDSGCLPSVPASSMTFGAFACVGFVKDSNAALIAVSQSAIAFTLPSSGAGTYWLMLYQNTSSDPSGWSRSATTTTTSSNYRVQKSATMPVTPVGGLIFASVTVDATPVITAVTPIRTTVIDLVQAGGCSGCSAATNTTALQAAASVSQIVYIPPGTYHLNAALAVSNKSFRLFGAGRGVSILIQDTAATNGLTYSTTNETDTLEVDHLTWQAGVAGAGTAISATWPNIASSVRSGGRFHDLELTWVTANTHYWTNGIMGTDMWNSDIHHNTIELKPPSGQTFNAGAGIKLLAEANDVLIHDNHIYHAQYAVDVGGTVEGVSITDNLMVSNDIAVHLSTAAAQPGKAVSGNNIASFTACISLDARTDTDVIGNLCLKHASSTQNWSGIILQNTATGSDWARIIGNVIGGSGTSGTENGIVLGRSVYSIVANNICHDMDGTCVWLQANAQLGTVTGNSQNGLASTITIDASATNNRVYDNFPQDNSGVTTLASNSATPRVDQSENGHFIASNGSATSITDFTNAYDGQVISVRVTEANTQFNTSAALKIQGGGNYGPAVNGAVLTFRRDGGVWYEVSRRTP